MSPTDDVPAADGMFRISSHRHGPARIMVVAGEVDVRTAPRFRAAVDALFEQTRDAIIIDLAGLTFLSSAGIAVLHTAVELAKLRHSQLRFVVGNSTPALRPIQVLRLDHVLPIHATVDAALASLPEPGPSSAS